VFSRSNAKFIFSALVFGVTLTVCFKNCVGFPLFGRLLIMKSSLMKAVGGGNEKTEKKNKQTKKHFVNKSTIKLVEEELRQGSQS